MHALQPATLGGVEDRLRAIDGAELAVDVVEVRADRARRERELERDLLVGHALGEALEDVQLTRGERARLDRACRQRPATASAVPAATRARNRAAGGAAASATARPAGSAAAPQSSWAPSRMACTAMAMM